MAKSTIATLIIVLFAFLSVIDLGRFHLPFQVIKAEELTNTTVIACSADKPVVWTREVITVRAWFSDSKQQSLTYSWSANGGEIDKVGREARWHFKNVKPGTYKATVDVSEFSRKIGECSVVIIVQERTGQRGRETGWSFLVRDQQEEEGFGLYSYVLFGSPPTQDNLARYRETINAYLKAVPHILALEKALKRQKVPRSALNINYLPVTAPPPRSMSVDWVLEHYDYAMARALLRLLPGDHRDGPYIVSSLDPLSIHSSLSGKYLYQDLSKVPDKIVTLWAKEFFNQAAQERFWETRTAKQFALKMRTTIAVLAIGLPIVQDSIDKWLDWFG